MRQRANDQKYDNGQKKDNGEEDETGTDFKEYDIEINIVGENDTDIEERHKQDYQG